MRFIGFFWDLLHRCTRFFYSDSPLASVGISYSAIPLFLLIVFTPAKEFEMATLSSM